MPRPPRAAGPPRTSARDGGRPVPERILAAAMALIEARGMQGFSQARVAATAGLRQSHLTYYFPTRKDLLKALVQAIHAELTEAMGAVTPAKPSTPASVKKIREFFARRVREPLLARLMLALMNAADEDPSLRRWLVDFDNDLIDRLGKVFTKLGLRPGRNALTLLHTNFIGIAIMSAHDNTPTGIARAERLIRLAFDRTVQAATPRLNNAHRTVGRSKART